jgi:hypothetical protein
MGTHQHQQFSSDVAFAEVATQEYKGRQNPTQKSK